MDKVIDWEDTNWLQAMGLDVALGKAAIDGLPWAVTAAKAGQALPSDNLFSSQWYLQSTAANDGLVGLDINVVPAWADYTGQGVTIAVVDDGFQIDHPEFDGQFQPGFGFDSPSGGTDVRPFHIDDDHGTAVAGIIGANANDGGVVGVAYGAEMVGVRLDFSENGTIAQDVAGLQFASQFDISNLSYGYIGYFADNFNTPDFSPVGEALRQGAENGRNGLGHIFVVAGGNERQLEEDTAHHDLVSSRYTIAVGVVGFNGVVADYSTPGASVHVVAPSAASVLDPVGILTTDRTGADGFAPGSTTDDFIGASGTAPQVAGVVALMLEANPNLGARDVQEILAYSARPFLTVLDNSQVENGAMNYNGGGMIASRDYGFGLVDATAAVRLAEVWDAQSTFGNETSYIIDAPFEVIFPNGTRDNVPFLVPGATVAIPDQDVLAFVMDPSPALVTGNPTPIIIDTIEVTLELDHTWWGNIRVTLTSPNGTEVELLAEALPAGISGETTLTLTTNQFMGEIAPVGAFDNWIIEVHDRFADAFGDVLSLSMTVYGDPVSTFSNGHHIFTDAWAMLGDDPTRQSVAETANYSVLNLAAITSSVQLDLTSGSNTLLGHSLTLDPDLNDFIFGDGDDTFVGATRDDNVRGMRGDDTLTGGVGNDMLDGGAGNDTLDGGVGNDGLLGGAGDDVLVRSVSSGSDFMNGGAGTDRIDLSAFGFAVWLDLEFNGADVWTRDGSNLSSGTWRSIADLLSVENMTGTAFDDELMGDGADNVFGYTGGLDQLDGRDGSDTVDFDAFDHAVWVDLAFGGIEAWTRDDADLSSGAWRALASLASIENITGTAFDDELMGDGADNVFGYTGGLDQLDGRGGTDTVDFDAFDHAVWVDLVFGGGEAWTRDANDLRSTGTWREVASLTGIENISGTVFDDILSGDNGDNRFIYTDGFDELAGRDGSDTADFNDFGSAVWIDLSFGGTQAWTRDREDLAAGTWRALASLDSVENVTGTAFDDLLRGDQQNNILQAGGGADLLQYVGGLDALDGGDGVDTVDFGGFGSAVWVDLSFADSEAWTRDTADLRSTGDWREIAGLDKVENITGTVFDDILSGDEADNLFTYTDGFDELDGRDGTDTADFSGFGSAVWIDLSFGGVEAWTRDGADLSSGDWRAFAIVDNIENLTGTAFDDLLKGTTGANVLEGGGGDDVFVFSGGNDTVLDFGRGSDMVDLQGLGLTFADVQANTIQQNAGAVFIDPGSGASITLIGVVADDLDAGDFLL